MSLASQAGSSAASAGLDYVAPGIGTALSVASMLQSKGGGAPTKPEWRVAQDRDLAASNPLLMSQMGSATTPYKPQGAFDWSFGRGSPNASGTTLQNYMQRTPQYQAQYSDEPLTTISHMFNPNMTSQPQAPIAPQAQGLLSPPRPQVQAQAPRPMMFNALGGRGGFGRMR